ncbi:polyketide cyclase [Micrococcus endophyticus]|uniref:polyketide cyclase n=1 Tax=Micrococcus endophyticus TaxID=455343 RepID=UPI0034CD0513
MSGGVRGIDRCVEAMQAAYGDDDVRFRCERSHVSESGSLVAALLVDDAGRRSLDVFEFKDGLVWKEHEFLLGRTAAEAEPRSLPTQGEPRSTEATEHQ